MGIWEGLKRGAKAMAGGQEPVPYVAGGQRVICPHCQSDEFVEGRALMNTFGMTFLNLDWANKEATTLMCGNCGLIQWFGIPPQQGMAVKPPNQEVDDGV